MAILYSYPTNTNILPTDIILGTSTVIVGGRPKNQTKSLKILDLTAYFASVLVPPGSYVPYTGAIGSVNLGVYSLTAGSIIKAGGTNLQFLMADGSVSTAPSLAGFVPYVGATQAVDLGAQDLYTTGQISTTDFVAGNDIYVGSLTSAIRVGRGPGNNGKSTVLGGLALSSVTTGDANTAIGVTALQATTSGDGNTAIGAQVLIVNTTGALNTAVGSQALRNNLVGNRNTAIGNNSLTVNTADDNTAVGYNSLLSNTSGANNVAIGVDSLKTNTTGTRNTAIGNSGLRSNTTGSNNTALGAEALYSNTIGTENVAVGYLALYSNTTSQTNVAIGNRALQNNVGGSGNTAVGHAALQLNTSGTFNLAIGPYCLSVNTTGNSNTAIGYNSLNGNTTGSNNVSLGLQASQANTTGFGNTVVGFQAFFNNVTGYNNTVFGKDSGRFSSAANLTTSIDSVFLGYNTKSLNTSSTNEIVIGAHTVGTGNNTATLGNTSITTTRLRGAVQGGSFVKDSGTSSQYLMADGSVTTVPYKYNFSGSLTLTGTLTTTNLLTITIPANSLSDYLDLRSLMVQQSGPALAGFQIRVWHNSVNDFNTATRIANFAFGAGGADLYAQMTRKFSIQSGTLFGFSSTPSNATGEGSNTNAALSIAFNTAIINYLFVSIQLTNATDTATLRNVNITT